MSVTGFSQRHEILQASLRCRLELDQAVDVGVYDDSGILKLVGDLFPYLLEIIVLNHFGIDQVICITYKGLVQVMKLDGVGVAAWTHQIFEHGLEFRPVLRLAVEGWNRCSQGLLLHNELRC